MIRFSLLKNNIIIYVRVYMYIYIYIRFYNVYKDYRAEQHMLNYETNRSSHRSTDLFMVPVYNTYIQWQRNLLRDNGIVRRVRDLSGKLRNRYTCQTNHKQLKWESAVGWGWRRHRHYHNATDKTDQV